MSGKRIFFRNLTVSEYEQLLDLSVPIKLYVPDDLESVDDSVFIVGKITESGVGYLVGVERRFVDVGESFFLIRNGRNKRVRLNRALSETASVNCSRRSVKFLRGYRKGGPRSFRNRRRGGPRHP